MSSPRVRPTILVIDDEPEVLRSVHDLLRIDYQVRTCQSGAEALDVLASPGEIHVIMSDQRMPGMSGVELLRSASQIRPESTRLLFTAHADLRAVVAAINEGHVFRYIAKPWDPDELQAVVRQAVKHHNLIVEKNRLLVELRETNAKLLEANRVKGAFIEVASHELNTPVTVVLGMTELWKMSQGPDASAAERGWVERIHGAAGRLARTVDRMLKLVKDGEFGHTLDVQQFDLVPLIRRTVDALNPYLEIRRQSVRIETDDELISLEADRFKLADVLINLLANAIKFTPDEGVIRIRVQSDASPQEVRISVHDEGVGVDPSDQSHLFEPFFTGFDTMHHSSGDFQFCKKGIGLGLCLVKTFVELHGGRVECNSEPGSGSTFAFTLPRRVRVLDGAKDPVSASASARETTQASFNGSFAPA